MRIWLISIFEQTPFDNNFSTRYLSIAQNAIDRGHDVTFLASTFRHNTKTQRYEVTTEETISDVYKAVYIKSLGYKSNFGIKRFYSHYKYAVDLMQYIRKLPKPDVILIAFPPIFLSYKIVKWAKENQIKVVADVIDPWPDNFSKFLPNPLKIFLDLLLNYQRKKNKETFSNLNGLAAISNTNIKWAQKYGSKSIRSACFYPAIDLKLVKKEHVEITASISKNKENLQVVYAGSLAKSYDIPCILESASILNKKYGDKIKFVIAGAGPQDFLIKQYLEKLSNLVYLGRVDKKTLIRVYCESDLGLTQHVPTVTQTVTYKLFDLLGNGLPILNSLDSEMKDIILDHRVGLFNPSGDAVTLAENIAYFYHNRDVLDEYSKNAIAITESLGDSSIVYRKFVEFLEQA